MPVEKARRRVVALADEAPRALLAAGTIPIAEIAKRLGIARRVFPGGPGHAPSREGWRLMPARSQHRWLYPLDWKQLSALVRFERAKGRGRHC